MWKKHPPIDWKEVDFVVGTREDITYTGIKRPCSDCGVDVYTSKMYPFDVRMLCPECALAQIKLNKPKL